eukprot:Transcript_18912.p1 GENE.Transcript_18912~~Transcript_18912.p1  ORF type:complete len:447 (+),score=207.07 Transcript_18912:120-1460(+)
MGASASRLAELEAAQAQVKRLTSELSKASASLTATSSKLSTVQAEANHLRQQAGQLQSVRMELADANKLASSAKREAQELPQLKEALKASREAEAGREARAEQMRAELEASKTELERVAGELKWAQQEQRSVSRLKTQLTDAQRELQAKQDEIERHNAQLVASANEALAAGAALQHPVFGELLHDYGHKRLYRASPLTLWAGTLVWDRQRAFRQERAADIATAKAKSSVSGWPGSICVVETAPADAATGAAAAAAGGAETVLGAVIDGQHRLGAAHLLSQRGKLSSALQEILVEVYPSMEPKGIGELFTEINKAEPVALIDLPEGGASREENAVLTEAAEAMRERYPEMFKSSAKCRAPHINVDVLRNELHAAKVLSRHELSSTEQLLQWLEARNAALAAREAGAWTPQGSRVSSGDALQKALAKARRENLYLGMTWAWLHEDKPK